MYLAKPKPELYIAGLAIAAIGEATRFWAAGHLDKNTRLTTSGPYAWTRNPLYFGSSLIGLGFALATGRLEIVAVVLVLFVAVYVPVMRREAAGMAKAFPEEYQEYSDRTPLFLARPPSSATRSGAFSSERLLRNREHLTVLGWLAVAAVIGWKLL